MDHHLKLSARYLRYCSAESGPTPMVERLALELATTALLLVDVYHGVQEGEDVEGISGPALDAWRATVGRIATGLTAARSVPLAVVYATNSAPRIALAQSEFGAHFRRSWCGNFDHAFREGGVDAREYHGGRAAPLSFPAELEPRPDEYYVRKHVYSAFFDTRLDSLLRDLNIHTLIMAGFWADTCMLATALDALYRNYRVVWLRDATLGDEEWAVPWFETTIGYTVSVAEFAAECRAAAPAHPRAE